MNFVLNIGIFHYLILAFLLFLTGILGILISRSMIQIVMSIFIMTIAIVTNFITFGFYCSKSTETTNILNVFILLVSVMQIITALVILYKIYKSNEFLDTEKIKDKEN